MDLYIHFGIYKTGSSYLQMLCGNNRSLLEKAGYYFPRSEREEDMLAGRISPGNARQFSRTLRKPGAQHLTLAILQDWIEEANLRKCDKLLISAEDLIHAFASKDGIKRLLKATDESGFVNIYCLGFFRDLVDHCLSTFKHRAKKGTIRDFAEWVASDYETPSVLTSFLENLDENRIYWQFRGYTRDGSKMAKIFFEDWLGLDIPQTPTMNRVNTSLTLSELVIIQNLAEALPEAIVPVYDRLIAIPVSEKNPDKNLNNYYFNIAQRELSSCSLLLNKLNFHLPVSEHLSEPKIVRNEHNEKLVAVLYPNQCQAILLGINESNKIRYIIRLYMLKLIKATKRTRLYEFYLKIDKNADYK